MTDSTGLLCCWREFDLSADEPEPPNTGVSLDGGTRRCQLFSRGVGVSGHDEADCLALIRDLLVVRSCHRFCASTGM